MLEFLGEWKRFKVENEKEMFKLMDKSVEYKKLKDLEVTIIINQKNETTFEEVYKKGSLNLKHIIHLTGKTKIYLEDGTNIKVSPTIREDKIIHEFDHNGIHRIHTRVRSGNIMIQTDDYNHGEVSVKHYFMKSTS